MSEQPGWWEWRADLAARDRDEALERLAAAGWDQVWLDEPVEHTRTPDGWHTGRRPETVLVLHVCLPRLEAEPDLAALLADLTHAPSRHWIQPEEWLTQWRESREVVDVGGGWCIAPPWLAAGVAAPAKVVVIDPGLAFGAGDHPTTRDSASLVVEAVRPGDRVLDLGAGSGVLSLLALKLGAAHAVAVESDELAAAEVHRNAGLNQLDAVTVWRGDARTFVSEEQFDLVLLNIGARESKALLGVCEQCAAPGARLIVSGLAYWAAPAVAEVYTAAGWRTRRRVQRGSDWCTLLLSRESDEPRPRGGRQPSASS